MFEPCLEDRGGVRRVSLFERVKMIHCSKKVDMQPGVLLLGKEEGK